MAFKENLKFLRIKKGLTAKELGNKASLGTRTILDYENGKKKPVNEEKYVALAQALGCTVEYLKEERIEINAQIRPKTFGEKLRAIRKSKNLTVKDLEKITGLNEQTIYKYEQDAIRPRSETTYIDLAYALGCTIEDLKDDPGEGYSEHAAKTPSFGEKIRKHRTKKNLKQVQIADELGISVSSYKYMENNDNRPATMEQYERLARILDCTVPYLVEGDDRMDPTKKTSDYFYERLNSLRIEKGLSWEQIAVIFGVRNDTLTEMRKRKELPRNKWVYKRLAKALGCEASYLI